MKKKILEIIAKKANNPVGLRHDLFAIFNTSQKKNYDSYNSTVSQDEEITAWITSNEIHFVGFHTQEHEKRVFINETQKVDFLLQTSCKICDDKLPITHFPVRITPITRQTKTTLKNQFQTQFSNSPFGKNINLKPSDKLCIKLVFVLRNTIDKDVDNMAKITLDCIKSNINIDDKNIDHLEIIKFKSKYLESYIHIRISKSDINTSNNIILKGTHMSWAGLPKLDEIIL